MKTKLPFHSVTGRAVLLRRVGWERRSAALPSGIAADNYRELASIPTGLRHSAQGCPRGRTTLGQSSQMIFNPNGVVSIRRNDGVQPLQGCHRFDIKPKVARFAQPWADGWNPVGIRTECARPRAQQRSRFERLAVLRSGLAWVYCCGWGQPRSAGRRFGGLASFFGQKQPKPAFEITKSRSEFAMSELEIVMSELQITKSDLQKPFTRFEFVMSDLERGMSKPDRGMSDLEKGMLEALFIRKMVKNRHLAIKWSKMRQLSGFNLLPPG